MKKALLSILLAILSNYSLFAQKSSIYLRLSDLVNNEIQIKLGIDSLATDGLDTFLDEEELPPYPPSGIFDARLQLPNSKITSRTDIRPITNSDSLTIQYDLRYQVGVGSDSLTLGWNLPVGLKMNLQDPFGGLILDEYFESGENSFTMENTSLDRVIITIDYSKTLTSVRMHRLPQIFKLYQNYPKPFNPTTTIQFGLPRKEEVTVKVYDLLGQEVEKLINKKEMNPGNHKIEWDARKYASGPYFLRIKAGDFTQTKKMILLK